jgi:hypothetical protein
MRYVEHFAVQADNAGAWCGLESGDDAPRIIDFPLCRRKTFVYDVHLGGMDGQAAGKPLGTGGAAGAA